MAKYDCVLTFDADFLKLEQASVEVLEEWVSSGAGGLIIVAGAVATPNGQVQVATRILAPHSCETCRP